MIIENEAVERLNDEICDIIRSCGNSEVADIISKENSRQRSTIELIASENYPSVAVRAACASSLMAKYAEGYPAERTNGLGNAGRYYGGCKNIDKMEEYCCNAWRRAFHTDYHVNVQPHSGSHANMSAYMAILNPGDKILSMDINDGGHLTHSSSASFVSKLYDVYTYGVGSDGYIDMDDVWGRTLMIQPKLIIAGASAYSREIRFDIFRQIADEVGAYLMADISHISGIIATGRHNNPFGLADIITTTSQKIARGPRGSIIFCKPELAKKVDSAVFPRTSGGPAENIIAAKAICADEMCTPEYEKYIDQVLANAKAMANEFIRLGYNVVTGGTDNHMFLLDFSEKYPELTGKEVQELLDEYGISLNKNRVPGDKRGPKETSGVRIGLPAMTTKGWVEDDAIKCANSIHGIIKEYIKNKK